MSADHATARYPRRWRRPAWTIAAIAVAVVAVLAVVPRLRRPRAPAQSAAAAFPVSVATLKTGAGKVGALVVTREALELAEITVAPAEVRVVAEKLLVSGVIEAGGDRTVAVTPRVPGRIVSVAVIIACGVNKAGIREILALEPMFDESEDSWRVFFRKLKSRGG